MIRGLIALVATFLIAFQLTVVVLGYQEYGTYPALGTLEPVDAYLTRIVDVSPEGAAAGASPRDVIDTRLMTIEQRIADYTHAWKGGKTLSMRIYHADGTAAVNRTAAFTGWNGRLIVDLIVRIFVLVLALYLIARGEGTAGVLAGVALLAFGLHEGYHFNWGAVPTQVGIAAFIIQGASGIVAYLASYFFAVAYMREQERRMPVALSMIYFTFIAFMTTMLAIERSGIFTGYAALNAARYLNLSTLLCTLGLIAIFGLAATNSPAAGSVRVLFWSYLIGAIGLECNQIAGFLGYEPPLDGALYLIYLVFALGLTYSVVAKRLTGTTLVLGRVAIYVMIVAIITAVFALIEHFVSISALPQPVAFAIELAVPLILGLMIPRIARGTEWIIEILLHREKLELRHSMAALIDDLPHMSSTDILYAAATEDVGKYLGSEFTVLYRESPAGYVPVAHKGEGAFEPVRSDDRVFLRMRSKLQAVRVDTVDSEVPGALAVPMDVGGQITGALVLGPRERDEPYDPDEIDMLQTCANVLGATLLRVERGNATAGS